MAYGPSFPLTRWRTDRRAHILVLEQAHAALGEVDNRRGRPLELGRPLAHSYVLRVVAEFQGFARDLHDLLAEITVDLTGAATPYRALLTAMATEGRTIDRGNADLRSLSTDSRRLGVPTLVELMKRHDHFWDPPKPYRSDPGRYQDLIALRKCARSRQPTTTVEAPRPSGLRHRLVGSRPIASARSIGSCSRPGNVGTSTCNVRGGAMVTAVHRFKVGDRVVVPWGVHRDVMGTVVEVWGDPPSHVRVELDGEPDEERAVLLLSPAILSAV